MAKTSSRDSPMKELRSALEDRGYALRLTTKRKGETVTARLELQNLEEDKSLMKLVASGRIEDLDLTVGFDLHEEKLWNFVMRLLGLWETAKDSVGLDTSE
ncbi:MAG: hypothetical protein ACE5LS_07225 [Thermoplasmata archaeon]